MLYQLSYRASDLKGRYWSMLHSWRNGFFMLRADCWRTHFPFAETASSAQPIIRLKPPSGVTAPSHFVPV